MGLSLRSGLTLYFCRHGETQANVEKRFQGQRTDTPLTATGRQQSSELALLLRQATPNVSTLSFVSSPLMRARTTMKIVLGALNLPVDCFSTAFTRILRGLFADMNWQDMSNLDEEQGVLFRVSGSTVTRLER